MRSSGRVSLHLEKTLDRFRKEQRKMYSVLILRKRNQGFVKDDLIFRNYEEAYDAYTSLRGEMGHERRVEVTIETGLFVIMGSAIESVSMCNLDDDVKFGEEIVRFRARVNFSMKEIESRAIDEAREAAVEKNPGY
jgi:hypothetical protein